MNDLYNPRIIDMNLKDLKEVMKELIHETVKEELCALVREQQKEDDNIKGLQGIADALEVSVSTLIELRKKGVFDGVIKQEGRVIKAVKSELLAAFGKDKEVKRIKRKTIA